MCWTTFEVPARETPVSPDAPEIARGEKPWHPLQIPELGIDFTRYSSKDCDVFICAWRNEQYSHVYEIRMRRVEDVWRVTCSNDGHKLCSMSSPSRQLAYRFALGGMRQYLLRGHRKALRTATKKEVAA